MTVEALLEDIARAQAEVNIEGVSVLGGEPMDQAQALEPLLAGVQALGLGVLLFSGYTLAQLEQRADWGRVWAQVDTLIDGRFEAGSLESRVQRPRRYVGSTNQEIRHRSQRYADPELWRGEAGVEVQVSPTGAVSLHGQPSLARHARNKLAR